MQNTAELTAVIANGAALSGVVDLGDSRIVGFVTPAAWTAASLSFDVSWDGVTYRSLRNDDATSTEFTMATGQIATTASVPVVFTEAHQKMFEHIPYVKFRSGTAGSPVNQGAARTFYVIVKKETK